MSNEYSSLYCFREGQPSTRLALHRLCGHFNVVVLQIIYFDLYVHLAVKQINKMACAELHKCEIEIITRTY